MAHLEGETSNSLFKILADWDKVLKHTSLAWQMPANANEAAQSASSVVETAKPNDGVAIDLSTRRPSLIRKRGGVGDAVLEAEVDHG
jgi:hypothetical protein